MRALQQFEPGVDDAARVDQIRQLEQIKAAAAAAQASVTAVFTDSQRAAQRSSGVPRERCERGIAAQVALAKRTSPYHARRYVGWAKVLSTELPATFAQLRAGVVPERRAMLVARETLWLSREQRAEVDTALAPRLEHFGDRRTETEVKRQAYQLDPAGFVQRMRNAEKDRRVTVRPAPDVMARLNALLPVREAIACHTALGKEADARRAAGDSRSRGQLMADVLTERLTGRAPADGVPIEVCLTMGADTLLAPDGERERDEPAWLHGYGPVPAPLARSWLLDPHRTAPSWLRRLYTRPDTATLIAMDSRRRCFTKAQARFIRERDLTCRTPYCDAPIRHIDHVIPVEADGRTRVSNGQGLCQACNHAKQAPGWTARAGPDAEVIITTPTGHRYRSTPPQPPGCGPPRSPVERRLAQILRDMRAA